MIANKSLQAYEKLIISIFSQLRPSWRRGTTFDSQCNDCGIDLFSGQLIIFIFLLSQDKAYYATPTQYLENMVVSSRVSTYHTIFGEFHLPYGKKSEAAIFPT